MNLSSDPKNNPSTKFEYDQAIVLKIAVKVKEVKYHFIIFWRFGVI